MKCNEDSVDGDYCCDKAKEFHGKVYQFGRWSMNAVHVPMPYSGLNPHRYQFCPWCAEPVVKSEKFGEE